MPPVPAAKQPRSGALHSGERVARGGEWLRLLRPQTDEGLCAHQQACARKEGSPSLSGKKSRPAHGPQNKHDPANLLRRNAKGHHLEVRNGVRVKWLCRSPASQHCFIFRNVPPGSREDPGSAPFLPTCVRMAGVEEFSLRNGGRQEPHGNQERIPLTVYRL